MHWILKNKFFYIIYILEIILFSWLNWENTMMHGILPYYKEFANYFQTGLSASYVFKSQVSTFPMWGYGLVLTVCSKKALLVIGQQLVSVLTIVFLQVWLRRHGASQDFIRWFRVFILLGFCWIIFHTAIWPYSLAANFTIISMCLLIDGLKYYKLSSFLTSSVLMGVVLNFRSDYLYFTIAIFIILVIVSLIKRKNWTLFLTSWLVLILVCLIPWGLHTLKRSGKFMLSSTNGGHVLYISLGQLPGNKWGIIPTDGDHSMKLLVEPLENGEICTLNSKSNEILTKNWLNKIQHDPLEYLKKCGYNMYLTLIRPFTNGEIYRRFYTNKDKLANEKFEIKKKVLDKDFRGLLNLKYSGFFLPIILNIFSVVLFIVFVFCFIKVLFRNLKNFWYDPIFLIFTSVILYQIALQTLAYYNPNYHTNIYLFYSFFAVCVISKDNFFLNSR